MCLQRLERCLALIQSLTKALNFMEQLRVGLAETPAATGVARSAWELAVPCGGFSSRFVVVTANTSIW